MTTENSLLQSREEEGGTYERALVASQFIDWLLQEGEMGTRAEAEQLGRRLLEHGIVQHGEAAAPGLTAWLLTFVLVSTADQSTRFFILGQTYLTHRVAFELHSAGRCGGDCVSPDSRSRSRNISG